MKNKKWLSLCAVALTCSLGLTACSLGGKKTEEVIVEETSPTKAPDEGKVPEKTEEKKLTDTLYVSKDGAITIQLPDTTWTVKMDEANIYSFLAPDQSAILIQHGAGEDALSTQIIPNSKDTAIVLEQGSGLIEGKDFLLEGYTSGDLEGTAVYTYVVKMLNAEEREYAYKVVKALSNDQEYYFLTGEVKKDDPEALEAIQQSFVSFKYGDAAAEAAANAGKAPVKEETPAADAAPAETETPAETPAVTENTENTPAAEGGIASYKDNPDNSDNTKTRTIYRNEDGYALVISINANGEWVDEYGNQYRFTNDTDVYDQDDVDYYYHGEAADVYYMPFPTEEE